MCDPEHSAQVRFRQFQPISFTAVSAPFLA